MIPKEAVELFLRKYERMLLRAGPTGSGRWSRAHEGDHRRRAKGGEKGDILIGADGIWMFETEVPWSAFRNLVGADDAWVGRILAGLSQGKDLIESVRYGMGAALASAKEKLCLEPEKIRAEMERVEVRRKA